MYILLNENNLIVYATFNRLTYVNGTVSEVSQSDNSEIVRFPLYNESNSSIVELEETIPPGLIVNKYRYENGNFIYIPNEDPFGGSFFENVIIGLNDFPLEFAEVYIDERVNKTIESLKTFHQTHPSFDNSLIRGLFFLDVPDEQLDEDELALKRLAENYKNKLRARYKIALQVGDIYDLIADLSKQINILTGLVVRMYSHLELDINYPEAIKENYDNFINYYRTAVDSGQYKDRADLENPTELVAKLMERNNFIADIVKTEYLDKRL